MHFGLTGAQEDLRATVGKLLAEVSPPARVRRLMETTDGYDPDVWARMAAEQGLPGLGVPERFGGRGLGWVEVGVALEEMGRVLLCAPYLATVTAAGAIVASGDEPAAADILPGIAAGGTVATLAVAEGGGRWEEESIGARATLSAGHGWRLDGDKSYVVEGVVADLFVVAARSDAGPALFLVDGDAPGLDRAPLATVDQTRKLARITLSATPARPLAGGSVSGALELAAAALAAEQVGGARHCLEAAVEHAGRRVQFGRPIGSFQAVKHLCADMLLEVESARSAAFYAAWAAASSPGSLPEAAAVAGACCSDAFAKVASDSLHVHGGLGFTWDHDAHLYFKRARSSRQLFGDPRHHRELLARHLRL